MGKFLDKAGVTRLVQKIREKYLAHALSGVSLDTIKDPGMYYGGGGNNCTGGPANSVFDTSMGRCTISEGFGLTVRHVASGWREQELHTAMDNQTWVRVWNTSAWSPWRLVSDGVQEMNPTSASLRLAAGGHAWCTNNVGYVRLLKIRQVTGYVNTALTFSIKGRSGQGVSDVAVQFSNSATVDGYTVGMFLYTGAADNYPKNMRLYKTAAGQWELWLAQTQSYDAGIIYNVSVPENMSVRFDPVTQSAWPSGTDYSVPQPGTLYGNMWLGEGRLRLGANGTHGNLRSGADLSPAVGGELGNVVIDSWYGVSFTTSCEGYPYTGKTAVGIDTRNGIVRAAQFQGAHAGSFNTIINQGYQHRFEIGRPYFNHWDFYEHGGLFNFYKCQDGTGANKTLIFKIDNGNVTLPGTLKAATLSGSLAWGKLTGVPAMVSQLVTWGKFVTEVTPQPALNQVWAGGVNGTSGVQTTITFNKVNGKSILASGSTSGNIDTTPPVATQSANGLMSAADKKRLDKRSLVLKQVAVSENQLSFTQIDGDTETTPRVTFNTVNGKPLLSASGTPVEIGGLAYISLGAGADFLNLKEGLYYKPKNVTIANGPASLDEGDEYTVLVTPEGTYRKIMLWQTNLGTTILRLFIGSMRSSSSSVTWKRLDLGSLLEAD